MREVKTDKIRSAVKDLCIKANTVIRPDVEKALKKALKNETSHRAKEILKILLENAKIAANEKRAICQDTGMAVVDMTIGQDVKITGGDIERAVNDGVKAGYKEGRFRQSVVEDPILRGAGSKAYPAVIYTSIVPGNKIKITVSPKGFGSENKSRIKMFNPTDGVNDIKEFVIDTVKAAGPSACPPFVVGIGIGGTFDRAALLAKKSLFRPINVPSDKTHIKKLEKEILAEINKLNIGPAGLGGKTTCLGVNILSEHTHIAGLPVAVNMSCHATRSATVII